MGSSFGLENASSRIIQVKAFCIIFRGSEILVFEGHDSLKNETYYRPLGGHIEFGESSEDAVRREFCEEVGSEIENLRFLQVFENIFVNEGFPGHEIVFLFKGDLADKTVYKKPFFYFQEENGESVKSVWKSMSDFQDGGPPLYPDGLLEYLATINGSF